MKALIFAGSLRKESFNKKFARVAKSLCDKEGIEATLVEIEEYTLPLYNGDEEQKSGLPENAKKLKKLFIEADLLIIASPEYNSSLSAPLKNLIDWVSRPEESDPHQLAAFKNKKALLLSASPGALGGLRGLFHLRDILMNMGTQVLPTLTTLPSAHSAFKEDGSLENEKKTTSLQNYLHVLVESDAT